MPNSRKKRIAIYSIVFVVFSLLLVFATFYDLDISKRIADLNPGQYQSDNLFGRIFETIGEMPVYFITIFASSIVFSYARRKENKKFVIILIFFELISFFMSFFAFSRIFKYLNSHYEFAALLNDSAKIAYALLSALLVYLVNVIAKKYSDEFIQSLLPWAVLTFVVVAFSQFITQICIKIPASRYRFCTMNTLNDFTYYTKWFAFNGSMTATPEMIAAGLTNEGLRSFPSGHTCAAATLLTLTAIPFFYKKADNLKYKIVSSVLIYAFILSVMFTRIIMGKHFLSDVLVGAFVTILCFALVFEFGMERIIKRFSRT